MPGSPTSRRLSATPADAPCGVLVIGGAGFIGSHLVDRLHRRRRGRRRRRRPVDRLARQPRRRPRRRRRLSGGELHIHTLDAGGAELGELIALRRPRADLPPGHCSRPAGASTGRARTLVHVDARRARGGPPASGVDKVVVALPATALYGNPPAATCPAKEGALVPRGRARASSPRRSSTCSTVYREQHGIEFTALAPATVYGPRQRPDGGVVAALVAAAPQASRRGSTGDGRQTRDFVYVDDVVDALVRARPAGAGWSSTSAPACRRRSATCGRSSPRAAAADVRRRPPRRAGALRVSPVRARIHLGWSPWTTLADGLERCADGAAGHRRVAGARRASPWPAPRRRPGSTSPTG